VRDDLVVDFTEINGGGLPALPASIGSGDYEGYLAVMPGETLADIYVQHGSRLLEGNVRTFLGRGGKVNRGISSTVTREPQKFFAYNNGITATASAITTARAADGSLRITSATDLQIVNGAQTTASLATSRRENSISLDTVFIPMKLSVVTPEVAGELIPQISRFANSQNGIRPSDFFANHPFHRRMEETSRRILAPLVGGSQIPTHWYYERARGQYLNDQAGMSAAQRSRFLLVNPRSQVITKTDLAKVACSFALEPEVTSKGAEKSFVSFAERVTEQWSDEAKRASYGDDWFKMAVAQFILFRSAEAIVSKASWYEGGYRPQIVAYTCARLCSLALERAGGGLDFLAVWNQQKSGTVLEEQITLIAERMASVLREPPLAGQNIGEWAKQQACRKKAMETPVTTAPDFDTWVITGEEKRANKREERRGRRAHDALDDLKRVLEHNSGFWTAVRAFGRAKSILSAEEERALVPACKIPEMIPTDRQATCILRVLDKVTEAGWRENAV